MNRILASGLSVLSRNIMQFIPPDDKVDLKKFYGALAAVTARNGWTKILQFCAPAKRKRSLTGGMVTN